MLDFRTDLADERLNECKKAGEIEGISSENVNLDNSLKVTKVKVLNEKGKKRIGKEIGTYITLEIQNMDIISKEELENISKILAEQLKELVKGYNSILVVGLGNIQGI